MSLFTEHLYKYPVHPDVHLLDDELISTLKLSYDQILSLAQNQPHVFISFAFITLLLFTSLYMIIYYFMIVFFDNELSSESVNNVNRRIPVNSGGDSDI